MALPLSQANQRWRDDPCSATNQVSHSKTEDEPSQSNQHEARPKVSRKQSDRGIVVVTLVLMALIKAVAMGLRSTNKMMFVFMTSTQQQNELLQQQLQQQSLREPTRGFHSTSFPNAIRYNYSHTPDNDNPPSSSISTSAPRSPFRFDASPDMLWFSEEASLDPVNSTYITSPSEVQQYRWKHRDRIPLDEPIVYIIMPTTSKRGLTQLDNLMSFGQTLKLDGNFYWVIVEDTDTCCSSAVRALLHRTGLPFAHVIAKSNPPKGAPGHRGVDQRNRGLEIVESLVQDPSQRLTTTGNNNRTRNNMTGVVYFADDDNTYDVRLFPALRETTTVGMVPVGLVGLGAHARCIVNRTTGRIMSLSSAFKQRERKFPVDMAAFAFHTDLLLPNNNKKRPRSHQKIRFNWMWKTGYLESKFVEQLASKRSDVNPLADNCTKLYVWHTKTASFPLDAEPNLSNAWHDVGTKPPPTIFPHTKDHHKKFPNETFDDYNEFAHIASRVGGVLDAEPRNRSWWV